MATTLRNSVHRKKLQYKLYDFTEMEWNKLKIYLVSVTVCFLMLHYLFSLVSIIYLWFSDMVIHDYLAYIDAQSGDPFVFNTVIYSAVSNIVTAMILGKQFQFNDPEMLQFKTDVDTFIQQSTNPKWFFLDSFPMLRIMFPFLHNVRMVNSSIHGIDRFMERRLSEVKKKMELNNCVSCFADKMLMLTKPGQEGNVPFLDSHDCKMIIFDFLVAGFATTSSALTALVLVLMNHPSVEQKIVDEIRVVIGDTQSENFPKLEHRDKMPFTNAVILELLRYISHVVFAIPHHTKHEMKICKGEYTLPANSNILINLWHMHHDANLWDNPWLFKPERFIDEDSGELFPPGSPVRQNLMAFGAGPRICPGETLAKNRLFLFIVAMYQRYKWMPPKGENPLSCDPRTFKDNFLLQPENFRVRVEPR